jgi:hypothetical protein
MMRIPSNWWETGTSDFSLTGVRLTSDIPVSLGMPRKLE